jgi:hypothetical protein
MKTYKLIDDLRTLLMRLITHAFSSMHFYVEYNLSGEV